MALDEEDLSEPKKKVLIDNMRNDIEVEFFNVYATNVYRLALIKGENKISFSIDSLIHLNNSDLKKKLNDLQKLNNFRIQAPEDLKPSEPFFLPTPKIPKVNYTEE